MMRSGALLQPEYKPSPHYATRRILLIEDNPADVSLMQLVHDDRIPWASLDVVNNAPEAMVYLAGNGRWLDMILLDICLPKRSGLELIADIKAMPGCESIPIVIISGSENPMTLREAYQLGANCVVRKANTLEESFRRLGRCFEFWCCIAELPNRKNW